MKTVQRVLYNQYNTDYCFIEDLNNFVVLHCPGTITTGTSAGTISLNIYSKLLAYAGGQGFVASLSQQGYDAAFFVVENRITGLERYCFDNGCSEVVVMDSSEAYISRHLRTIQQCLAEKEITLTIRPNTQFLISDSLFKEKYTKPPVMETFYRWMRKETGILMDNGVPLGGEWNYDKDNRKFDKHFINTEHWSATSDEYREAALSFYANDISDRGHTIQVHFPWTRKQAVELLEFFVEKKLDRFGELEDAMYTTDDFVFHSLLSVPINFGLLTPQEVISAVEKKETAINNKEGFIRQILGRREYMYHRFSFYQESIYSENALNHTIDLPRWFWRPDESPLGMNCVDSVLHKVHTTGYAHHIERLMIVGNFSLLVGYNPHHVNKWFWEQFADAFERVVTPNVLGMSQFADGGNLATKPYVASANYVKKMSNFCASCQYDPKEKYGENACPLNYLYWNFVDNNQETLKKGRQSFIVSMLAKMDMPLIKEKSKQFIDRITKKD